MPNDKKSFNKDSSKNKNIKGNKSFQKNPKDAKGKDDKLGYGAKSNYINIETSRNDPFWYAKDEQSLRNIFAVPFSERMGDELNLQENFLSKTVQGIKIFTYVPSIGRSVDNNSALTRAANTIYAYIYQGYTSNPSFEAPDLIMYLISVADLISNIAEAKRLYRVLFKLTHWNRYLGKTLYMALCNDMSDECAASYDEAKVKLANIRERLNLQMTMIRDSFVLPGSFPIIERWKYLASTILGDGLESKAQLYAYVKTADLLFDDVTYPTGSSIQLVPRKNTVYTTKGLFKLLDIIDKQISALSQNTSVNDMSGAIRRVYKDVGLYQMVDLVEGESQEFTYNELELHQIHNIEPIGDATTSILYATYEYTHPTSNEVSYPAIVDDATAAFPGYIRQLADGTIYSRPKYAGNYVVDSANSFPRKYNHIIDIHSDFPSAIDVAEATRGKAAFMGNSDLVPGTEIFITSKTIGFQGTGYNIQYSSYHEWSAQKGTGSAMNRVAANSKFDWAPVVIYCDGNAEGKYDPTTECYLVGELCNYSCISNDTLKDMNERIFWQVFNMPANIASVTK